LLAQVKVLSQELGESRTQVHNAIEAQKQQQLLQWQELEKKYLAIIKDLRGNLTRRENTVSMDIYRHAVAEAKRHAEQSQYYRQCAKNSSERIQSLERVVLARKGQQHSKNSSSNDETRVAEEKQKEKPHRLFTDDLWRPTQPDRATATGSAGFSSKPAAYPTSVPPRRCGANTSKIEQKPTTPAAVRFMPPGDSQPLVPPPPTTAKKNVSKPESPRPAVTLVAPPKTEKQPDRNDASETENKSRPVVNKPPPPPTHTVVRFVPSDSQQYVPPPPTTKTSIIKPEPQRPVFTLMMGPPKTDKRLEQSVAFASIHTSKPVSMKLNVACVTPIDVFERTQPEQLATKPAPTSSKQETQAPTLRSRPTLINTTSGNKTISKQVRFKISRSPRPQVVANTSRDAGLPIPQKAPPEPFLRVQPSKENSWMTPSRSSASKLSLVRAVGGRLKLQSILREKRHPLKEFAIKTN
jgi:hypothetical protein